MKFNRIYWTIFIVSILLNFSFNNVRAVEPDFLIQRVDGKSGSGNGEFGNLWDILQVGDNYYIADYYNDRIEVFDKNFVYVNQFGGTGSGLGQLDGPYSLYFNGTDIFVVESVNSRISIFNPNGGFIASFGVYGTGNGQLNIPTDIVSDGDRLYVSNYGNARIEVFNATAFAFMNKFTPTQIVNPHRLAVDHDILYVGELSTDSVVKLDKLLGTYRGNAIYYSSNSPGYLDAPHDIQFINNHIVVVGTANEFIGIYTMEGTFVEEIRANFLAPSGCILDQNKLLVSNFNKPEITIVRVVANPTTIQTLVGDYGITITWDINQNEGATRAVNYNIFRDSGSGMEIIGQTSSFSFSDTSVQSNVNYTYAVEAVSSITTSDKIKANPVTFTGPVESPQDTVTETNNITVIDTVTDTITQKENVTVAEASNSSTTDGNFFSNLPVDILPMVLVLIMVPVIMRRRNNSLI